MNEMYVISSIVFLFGAIIGSFLNVCIVRLPQEKSVVFPGSHCVRCKHALAWYDNIPFISYLLLLGKCRYCKEKISPRYFLVELTTACSFVFFYTRFGLSAVSFAYTVMLCGFIVATFVDFEHRIIPDEISIGGMWVGLALSLIIPGLHVNSLGSLAVGRIAVWGLIGSCFVITILDYLIHREAVEKEDIHLFALIGVMLAADVGFKYLLPVLEDGNFKQYVPYLASFDAAIIGLLFGGGSIYLMGLIGDIIFRKESMGGGDVKLMAMVGAFMGWKLALLTFFIAPFFGAFYGIAEKIRTKDSAIAYGPFLVLGALISLLWGEQLIAWILSGYGIY